MTASRFRFRAWDKERREMHEPSSLMLVDSNDGVVFYNYGSYEDDLCETALILMQSTGLVDSKGAEVFEVDIVANCVGNYVVCWDALPYHHAFVRVPVDKYLQFKIYQETGEGSHPVETDCVEDILGNVPEVIGNIYQHPHLLKGE